MDFFSKCNHILQIGSHLLKKSLMENFVFCAVVNKENQKQSELKNKSE